jgi:hypothetical protein
LLPPRNVRAKAGQHNAIAKLAWLWTGGNSRTRRQANQQDQRARQNAPAQTASISWLLSFAAAEQFGKID